MPSWPGVRRTLMAPGCYTELFFLDEATALAAGHRPCGSCRPDALAAFKRAWAIGHHLRDLPRVAEIDSALRVAQPSTAGPADKLPDGAMITAGGSPLLWWGGHWLDWSFDGYAATHMTPLVGKLLTPKPIIAVLKAGYVPILHRSALGR